MGKLCFNTVTTVTQSKLVLCLKQLYAVVDISVTGVVARLCIVAMLNVVFTQQLHL